MSRRDTMAAMLPVVSTIWRRMAWRAECGGLALDVRHLLAAEKAISLRIREIAWVVPNWQSFSAPSAYAGL